ncbi:MAG: DNA polymerase III subunit gamma/tau [Parcubacteria group bacterium]|nr:DNA polymerase III subunit gamma/tau [Parcubacteria group bacterium]
MTLYRTYRPKTFAEVIGRDDIKHILTEQIKANALAHAYLFSGVRGTGKTTLARLVAKAANCSSRDKTSGEPCNACASCQAINQGRAQDLIEIDAASNRRIEEIRELREMVKYAPANSPYKVYIIDEVHMLTREAFNALLKTLEEPPKHVIFILATTELAKIPDTIFSRCQHFSFGLVPLAQIVERLRALLALEKAVMDDAVIVDIARRSSGSLRDAESLLGQILSIGKKEITAQDASLFLPKVPFGETLNFLAALVNRDAHTALELLAALEAQGINLTFFIANCLEYARQLVLYAATGDEKRLELHYSKDEITEFVALAGQTDSQRLREITSELLRASHDSELAPDMPSLALELAAVLLCGEEEPKKELAETKTTESSAIVSTAVISSPPPAPSIPAVPSHTEPTHSLEEILDGWGEVLAKARNKNQALNFVLGVAEPVQVNGNTLELAFKYRLQQEKVLELKNRETVETIIKEVYGTSYRIQPTVQERLKATKEPREQDDLVKAVLEVFQGAEILN